MAPNFVISSSEARALKALADAPDTRASELALATQLSPSQIRHVVTQLDKKKLASYDRKTQSVRLLDSGRRIAANLGQPRNHLSGLVNGYRVTIVVPDSDSGKRSAPKLGELDRAINAEIQKMK